MSTVTWGEFRAELGETLGEGYGRGKPLPRSLIPISISNNLNAEASRRMIWHGTQYAEMNFEEQDIAGKAWRCA